MVTAVSASISTPVLPDTRTLASMSMQFSAGLGAQVTTT